MAQFVVRNVESSVKMRLQRRARRHGHSMEEEIRDILRNAVKDESSLAGGLGTEISSLFSKVGLIDNKIISSPLEVNAKLISFGGEPLFDVILYYQLVSSLIYLINSA